MFKIIIERAPNKQELDAVIEAVSRKVEKNVLLYALGLPSFKKTDDTNNKTRDGSGSENDIKPENFCTKRVAGRCCVLNRLCGFID